MKTLTKKEQLITWFMNNKPNVSREIYKDIIIVKHSLCSVAIWETKSQKPDYHYRFNNAVELEQFITKRKEQADKREEHNKKKNNEYEEKKKGFVVGAILYSSWGYEQTNIDWFVVLERKNDFVILQQIGSDKKYDDNYGDRGSCMPDINFKIGSPFRKKITKYASINLNSYSWCGLWDGKSKGWSSYA